MPKPATEEAKQRRNRLVRLLKGNIDRMDDFEIARLEKVMSVAMGRVLYGMPNHRRTRTLWEQLKERIGRFSIHI